MISLRLTIITVLAAALLAACASSADEIGRDQEIFNQGKVLMFDKKWEDARGAFQRVIQAFPNSSLVPQAHYFSARCLQLQGKEVEALRSYEQFLQRYPNEPYLQAEARSRASSTPDRAWISRFPCSRKGTALIEIASSRPSPIQERTCDISPPYAAAI